MIVPFVRKPQRTRDNKRIPLQNGCLQSTLSGICAATYWLQALSDPLTRDAAVYLVTLGLTYAGGAFLAPHFRMWLSFFPSPRSVSAIPVPKRPHHGVNHHFWLNPLQAQAPFTFAQPGRIGADRALACSQAYRRGMSPHTWVRLSEQNN